MTENRQPSRDSELAIDAMAEFDVDAGHRALLANVASGVVKLSDPPSAEVLDKIELDRLAALPRIEYDRERKAAAKLLQIRPSVLDLEVDRRRTADSSDDKGKQGRALKLPEPEPWREEVKLEALLDEIATTLTRHLTLPDGAADVLALWVVHSYVFEASPITPRLAITSPTMSCGKSTLLGVLGALVSRPLPAANVSPAAIFRTVEIAKPTFLIDEADSFLTGNEELRGVLNSGHRSDGSVIRLVGDDHEPRQFATFAPAAIACIGKLPATLMNRSIVIQMRRRRPDEPIEELADGKPKNAERLASQCTRWAKDHSMALRGATPEMPHFLFNRLADNWRPLFAIADKGGGDWSKRARAAARVLSGDDSDGDNSAGVLLLADLKAMFEAEATDRLTSTTIVAKLGLMEDRPWSEWRHDKPITARQVARLLAPFGIAPKSIRIGGQTPKGYELATFDDVFTRYQSFDPQQRNKADGTDVSSESPCATPVPMLRSENCPKPNNEAVCGGVADRNPQPALGDGQWMG